MSNTQDAREADSVTVFNRGFVGPPLVSVIVTCYNYERYITDCLRSILGQSYPRIECIIVDDCSTDNSVEVVRTFIAGTEGAGDFRLLPNEVNGGQMRSMLNGFRASQGAFIVFVDADDMLFPDFVETHVAAHLNRHFIAGLSCSDEILIDGENAVTGGSIEIGVKGHRPVRRIGQQVQPLVSEIEGWRDTWRLGPAVALAQPDEALRYVSPTGNVLNDWIWTTTSAVMFRRGVLELALTEQVTDIRICADFFLLHFCHLMGGTLLILSAHGSYRRHGQNHFSSNAAVATGLSPGGGGGRVTNEQLWGRVRAELLRQFPQLSQIVGVPRLLWIIASVGGLRECLAVSHAAAERFLFGRLKFLMLILFIRLRRRVYKARRLFRLI